MAAERISTLFTLYMEGKATNAERLELAALTLMAENTRLVKHLEQEYWEKMKESEAGLTEEEVEKLMRKIGVSKKATIKSLLWKRIAVAASIAIVLGLGSYFLFFNKSDKKEQIVKIEEPAKDVEAPKVTKAMITLANGQQVLLDSLTTLSQGNVNIEKTKDGQIVYNGSAAIVEYNVMINPRGSKVQPLTLNDGTKVWLNAESSIKFPTAFIGNERSVEITGEAYFEAAHDATKPFIVKDKIRGTEVQVIGTHFNVNTYTDELTTKITLLEGSVKVNQSVILKPGQQAQVANETKVLNNVDIEQVMAWKNGNFKFSRTDLKIIMREIGRWYDVEVVYEGNIPVQLYNVGVPRTANVSEVLKGLEYTGAHFSVEGKKIIVRP